MINTSQRTSASLFQRFDFRRKREFRAEFAGRRRDVRRDDLRARAAARVFRAEVDFGAHVYWVCWEEV